MKHIIPQESDREIESSTRGIHHTAIPQTRLVFMLMVMIPMMKLLLQQQIKNSATYGMQLLRTAEPAEQWF